MIPVDGNTPSSPARVGGLQQPGGRHRGPGRPRSRGVVAGPDEQQLVPGSHLDDVGGADDAPPSSRRSAVLSLFMSADIRQAQGCPQAATILSRKSGTRTQQQARLVEVAAVLVDNGDLPVSPVQPVAQLAHRHRPRRAGSQNNQSSLHRSQPFMRAPVAQDWPGVKGPPGRTSALLSRGCSVTSTVGGCVREVRTVSCEATASSPARGSDAPEQEHCLRDEGTFGSSRCRPSGRTLHTCRSWKARQCLKGTVL